MYSNESWTVSKLAPACIFNSCCANHIKQSYLSINSDRDDASIKKKLLNFGKGTTGLWHFDRFPVMIS